MFEEKELTYGEVIEARTRLLMEQYEIVTTEILRNIKLNIGDIEKDILTKQFFERKDVGNEKIRILMELNYNLIKDISEL